MRMHKVEAEAEAEEYSLDRLHALRLRLLSVTLRNDRGGWTASQTVRWGVRMAKISEIHGLLARGASPLANG